MNRITLAPTTLPDTPPLEYIQAAVGAGFEGLGFRLHKSPAYPNWHDWLGDAALKREVKSALEAAGQEMVESLSYYLLPDLDLDEMKPSLEYAADLGATYALVIGRDPEWSRQRDNFGRFCDVAAGYGLTAAIEAPVGTLSPISAAFRVIAESGRQNAVVCIDPTAFLRAGDTPATLDGSNPALLPYTQINDGKRDGGRSHAARRRRSGCRRAARRPTGQHPGQSGVARPEGLELHRRGMGQLRDGRHPPVPERVLRSSNSPRMSTSTTGNAVTSRRGFLRVVAGGAALPLLAACGQAAPTAPSSNAATAAAPAAATKPGSAYPTFMASTGGPKPDFPASGPQYEDGFSTYPKNPVKALPPTPPGLGSKVLYYTNNSAPAPPTPLDQNQAWQTVNKELNAEMSFTIIAQADYLVKLATVMAGNDLPDIMLIPGANASGAAQVKGLTPFLAAQCADLTPYLGGVTRPKTIRTWRPFQPTRGRTPAARATANSTCCPSSGITPAACC